MAKILIYIQSLSFSKEYGRFNFFGILSDFGCFLSRWPKNIACGL